MKFMLMIMTDEAAANARPPEEAARVLDRHIQVSGELGAAGKRLGGERLQFSPAAKTLRRRGDDWVVLDGPFAETKELLGGFYLIDAESKEEAVGWARKILSEDAGGIEVRPCRTGAQWSGPVRGKLRYLLTFVAHRDSRLSREEIFASIDNHYELSLELAAQGRFVGSRSLEAPATAVSVRRRNGEYLVTDGPFAETKEFIVGYFVVACDDPDEAVDWARQLAVGNDACEVRPVWTES